MSFSESMNASRIRIKEISHSKISRRKKEKKKIVLTSSVDSYSS